MKSLKKIIGCLAIIGLGFTSCKKENVTANNPSSTSDAGTFKVRMTDAPGDYEGLFVEIDKVEAYLEGSGWVDLNTQSQMVSVLDLTNGNETNIAFASGVAAGTYSKVRLTFGDENRLKLNSTSEIGLQLGEGMSATGMLDLQVQGELPGQKTVEIVINEEINANSGANVLLDFNVAQSIIENQSGFVLNPVILSIEDEQTGLSGKIEGAVQASIVLKKGSFEASTGIDQNGNFLIRGLADGTYSMLIDAEVSGKTSNEIKTFPTVTVIEGRIQNMGTIQL